MRLLSWQSVPNILPDSCWSRRNFNAAEARNVFRGTAKTFNFHSQASQRLDGKHPPVCIECNHVRKHTTKRARLWRLAKCIHQGVVPRVAVAHVLECSVKFPAASLQPRPPCR